jgi:hypothetical protein
MEHYSFRAYLSILYSTPYMKIYINDKKVQTKILEKTLFKPVKYTYTSSRFKNKAIASIKTIEDSIRVANSKEQEATSDLM